MLVKVLNQKGHRTPSYLEGVCTIYFAATVLKYRFNEAKVVIDESLKAIKENADSVDFFQIFGPR